MFAALLLAWTHVSPRDLRLAVHQVLATVQAALERTVVHAAANGNTVAARELRVVQSLVGRCLFCFAAARNIRLTFFFSFLNRPIFLFRRRVRLHRSTSFNPLKCTSAILRVLYDTLRAKKVDCRLQIPSFAAECVSGHLRREPHALQCCQAFLWVSKTCVNGTR
jgi:hypothetical protein